MYLNCRILINNAKTICEIELQKLEQGRLKIHSKKYNLNNSE